MNIKTRNFLNINKNSFNGIEKNKKRITIPYSTSDVFVRSKNNIQKTNLESKKYNLKDIQKLYDDVLQDSLKIQAFSTPIINKLKLEKPSIRIAPDSDMTGIASYAFVSNTISISEKFLNSDLYLCYSEDKQTGTIIPFGIYQEASLKKEIEALGEYNFQPKSLKLTEQEKELYIASSLAHETKHFIQSHLIASTAGLSEKYLQEQIAEGEKYNEFVLKYNENFKQIQDCVEDCRKKGIEVIPELLDIIATQKPKQLVNTSYAKKYLPNTLINQNNPIKFSILLEDTRTITPKDLYEASKQKQTNPNPNNDDAYYSNLVEIDAYYHAFEYLLSVEKKYTVGIRKIVLEALLENTQRSALIGISCAEGLNKLPSTNKDT